MRASITIATVFLTLVPAVGLAQTGAAAPQAPAATSSAVTGWLDLGVRGTAKQGDLARYERYRDLGDGLFIETARISRDVRGWELDFTGLHVGRRDQRLRAEFAKPGRVTAWTQWDQIPMLMSTSTRTLFSFSRPDVLEIDDTIQSQVQASVGTLPGLFQSAARTFDTKSRRHIFETGAEVIATPELTLRAQVKHTDREGVIPYGGSFGHSSLVEPPAPVNHTLTDVDAGAEFQRDRLLVRGGYTASLFTNEHTTLTFDNPFRLTDSTSAPGRGRASLPPSSSMFGVNGLVSVTLPARSRVMAYGSTGWLSDAGDPLMANTVNTATPVAPLERTTVEGEARTTAMTLSFTSRPTRMADLNVRYRRYDYDNRTPEFAMTQRVSYDNSPSNLASPVHTEPFGIVRETFDADVRITPRRALTAGVGFSRLGEERNHRVFESTAENVVRFTVDSIGSRWFTVRSRYEHSQKRGEGLDESVLSSIGEQPALRQFDIASRDRDRVTLLGTVTATDILSFTASVAAGKDDYLESVFGLRDNTHRVYSLGFDVVPSATADVHASYSYERYNALSRSRQANPGAQFEDPSRNWATDSSDRAHAFFLNAAVRRIRDRIDLNLSYDFSRARATYNYITGAVADRTLPEEIILPTTLPDPTQLPPTLSQLHRGILGMTYWATDKVGLGLSYWYENYKVEDFTLDEDANRELARGQVLLVGYFYRPYTANTVWGRLIYAF